VCLLLAIAAEVPFTMNSNGLDEGMGIEVAIFLR
jgi:hypothetical protein